MLERFIKYLPLVSVAAIIISYCHLASYYASFNIDIASYIQITDLLVSLLPISVLLILGFYLYFIRLFPLLENASKQTKTENKVEYKNIDRYVFFSIVLIAALFYIGTNIFMFEGFSYVLLVVLGFFGYFSSIQLYRFTKTNKYATEHRIVWLFLLCVFLSVFFGLAKGSEYKRIGRYRNVTFCYKTTSIRTGDSLLYVDLLGDHLFIHNTKTDKTTVFNYSSLDSVSFSKR